MIEPSQGGSQVELLIRLLHEVGEELSQLSSDMAAAAGSHPTDLHAVSLISRHGDDPLTVGALREHIGLSPAATTALVDRLESSGHVCRVRDEHDRRRVFLHATQQAHDTATRVLQRFLDELRSALTRYDEDELAAAARVLTDVREALAKRNA